MKRARKAAAGITVCLLAVVLLPGAAFADEVRDGQWYLDTLNVHDAHELSQGAGVTIGVIDTGVDAGHVDFDGRVVGGTDLIYSDRDGLSDDYGHGTSVASVLIGDNDADGVMGIAPAATVLSVNIFEDDAKTSDPLLMGPAIHWLIDNGADVISISVGGGGDGATQAAIDRAVDNNIPIVAAVSNRYADVGYGREEQTSAGFPAALPRVIPVTATARDSKFWEGSVDLSQTAPQPRFGIAAPGVDIPIALPGNNYDTVNGTSMSAPIVAGTLALIKSAYPDLDHWGHMYRLSLTADDKGPEGYDDKYGWGIVNPLAALTEDVELQDGSFSTVDDILPLEEQGKRADDDGESGASVGDDEADADAGMGVGVPVWAWITVAAVAVLGAGVIA
ncbi:MAG TPA: S8 family serine peptidase, partial [Candidatus Stackebrandtia excrementipullorum]|nr:S8 family serine peptidase [Candidatus Stackebrandtia excrementipullorum]